MSGTQTMTIRGKQYPRPHINRLKRKQAKALKPLLGKIQTEEIDALWDVVALLVPTLPKSVLDDLDLGECKQILTRAGVAKFDDDEDASGDEPAITMGESGASTGS